VNLVACSLVCIDLGHGYSFTFEVISVGVHIVQTTSWKVYHVCSFDCTYDVYRCMYICSSFIVMRVPKQLHALYFNEHIVAASLAHE